MSPAAIALLCFIGVIVLGIQQWWANRKAQPVLDVENPLAGWVYFIGPSGEGPIKIGFTSLDPTEDRLPDLRTMSPYPLRILYKFYADDARYAEKRIHQELKQFRLHGEWFDRDVTLGYISHLKGEH